MPKGPETNAKQASSQVAMFGGVSETPQPVLPLLRRTAASAAKRRGRSALVPTATHPFPHGLPDTAACVVLWCAGGLISLDDVGRRGRAAGCVAMQCDEHAHVDVQSRTVGIAGRSQPARERGFRAGGWSLLFTSDCSVCGGATADASWIDAVSHPKPAEPERA